MPVRRRDEDRLRAQRFLGSRLRLAREAAGMSQRELAQAAGFSHTWVAAVESGVNGIDAHDLQALADLLDRPIEWFTRANFDAANMRRPTTPIEWEAVYPDAPYLARLHWEIDRTMRDALRAGFDSTAFERTNPEKGE